MTEHTKEPWAHRNGRIFQADRDVLTIANIARASDGDYSETNARRIVAAVNYCKGLPTEGMETAIALGKPAEVSLQQLVDAIAQRDQLLAALKFYADEQRYMGSNQRIDVPDVYGESPSNTVYMWDVTKDRGDIARQAIAAVKGV